MLLVIFLLSSWSWEMFSSNFYLFIILSLTSLFCYLSFIKAARLYSYIFLLLLTLILFWQYQTTIKTNIFTLSPLDQYQLQTRRADYSNNLLARIEENKISNNIYKFQQNFFRSIDFNLFFFGNHPRERAGIREFEKFSPLFILFFFIGLIEAFKKYNRYILFGLIISILELAFIGQNNDLGPFILFPFFVAVITLGLNKTFDYLKNWRRL